jgi:hypothetical protein
MSQVSNWDIYPQGWPDYLHSLSIRNRKGRAEGFMALNNLIERTPNEFDIKCTLQSKANRHGPGGIPWPETVKSPEPLLPQRRRKSIYFFRWRTGRCAICER